MQDIIVIIIIEGEKDEGHGTSLREPQDYLAIKIPKYKTWAFTGLYVFPWYLFLLLDMIIYIYI